MITKPLQEMSVEELLDELDRLIAHARKLLGEGMANAR